MPRVAHEGPGLVDLHDAARVHHRDPIGGVARGREVVGDREHRQATRGLEVAEEREDLRTAGRILLEDAAQRRRHARGQIQGQDMRGNANVVNAMVPLMNMFGYVNNLRSMSQGRATFTMQFDHYAELPANVSAEVQKKFA